MDNIIFNDNIEVSITKSPDYPIEGDDVVFTANAYIANVSDYSIPSNYFFSYTWMESQDGGVTYYKVGQDLEILTIPSISKSFFNNLYKVQVALIDLENIILTEDGNSLTTQFGEILIGNNTSLNMSIQTINNSMSSDAPSISADESVVSLDIVNLNSIIDEALAYDTTLDDINQAIVSGGQITIDKNNSGQILNGTTAQQITPDSLPDPGIIVPPSVLSIQANDRHNTVDSKKNLGCTIINFKTCEPDPAGPYATLEECPGCRNTQGVICKSLNSYLQNDGSLTPPKKWPQTPNYGVLLGTVPTHAITNKNNNKKEILCCTPLEVLCEGDNENEECQNTKKPDGQAACLDQDSYIKLTPPNNLTTDNEKLTWIKNQDENLMQISYYTITEVKNKIFNAYQALQEAKATAAKEYCACRSSVGGFCYLSGEGTVGNTQTGKHYWNFTCYCPKKYYKKRIKCGNDIKILEPEQELQALPGFFPTYDCKCKSNNTNDSSAKSGNIEIASPGSVLLDNKTPPCSYYVVRWCGTANTHCDCEHTQDSKNNAPAGSTLTDTYSFDTPKAGELDYNIQYPPLASCYDPVGCQSTCEGLDCCKNSAQKTIWEKRFTDTENVKCNRSTTIYTQFIDICNPESDADYSISKYDITQKFRQCQQKTDNQTTFDSESDAEKSITDPAVIKYIQLINDADAQEKLKNTKPKLETISTYATPRVFYGSRNLDIRCSTCQVIYKVVVGSYSYPCRDTTSNPNVNCGLYNQCNVDSADTTPTTTATISKVESPTIVEIGKAKKGEDGFYDDFGKAMAYAKAQANPGIVLSSPCP
jgi:hypothetical protein